RREVAGTLRPVADEFFNLPPECEAGVYANTFTVGHSMSDFTLDFATRQSTMGADEPPLIVARVRIPPSMAFALIQAINSAMADYEEAWGEIVVPQKKAMEE